MPVSDEILRLHDDMTAWRRHIHAHPEIAFEEVATADFVAARLEEFGIPFQRGWATTGIVGSLVNGDGPAIALRADMDALPIPEANDLPYRSGCEGKMHACGHDGHTAMLLGAARYLAETRRFNGTVHFIFQPAEENEGGARVMVDQGLFSAFPVRAVYGMHNWPGLAMGRFAMGQGPLMAAFDVFEATISGRGGHAAMPHLTADPIVAAAAIVGGLQTVASRAIHPADAAVVSVTRFNAGDTWNVIPDKAVIAGTTRSLRPEVRDRIEELVRHLVTSIAIAHGVSAEICYERRYPATINHAHEVEQAIAAALDVVGADCVELNPTPSMGAEDFAFMLETVPGCYIWLGNGRAEHDPPLHNPRYDFNDAVLPIGASYWARLVERVLA